MPSKYIQNGSLTTSSSASTGQATDGLQADYFISFLISLPACPPSSLFSHCSEVNLLRHKSNHVPPLQKILRWLLCHPDQAFQLCSSLPGVLLPDSHLTCSLHPYGSLSNVTCRVTLGPATLSKTAASSYPPPNCLQCSFLTFVVFGSLYYKVYFLICELPVSLTGM